MKILNSDSFMISIYICIVIGGLVDGSTWSYSDVTHWSTISPSCAGHYQSPIDISSDDATYEPNLGKIAFKKASSFDLSAANYTVTNNGHSVKLDFGAAQWEAVVPPDSDRFELVQMHFHWGADNSRGSEHLIGGKQYPLETHIVTYNKRLYTTASDGMDGPHGLAVFAIMHYVDDSVTRNQTLFGLMGDFESKLAQVTTASQSVTMTAFDATTLLTHTDASSYYRYPGSLTTPPCTQNVMWTVFTKPVPVTSSQLNLLRSLETASSKPIHDNYRPPQPLNDPTTPLKRKVYRSAGVHVQFEKNWWLCAVFVSLIHFSY